MPPGPWGPWLSDMHTPPPGHRHPGKGFVVKPMFLLSTLSIANFVKTGSVEPANPLASLFLASTILKSGEVLFWGREVRRAGWEPGGHSLGCGFLLLLELLTETFLMFVPQHWIPSLIKLFIKLCSVPGSYLEATPSVR